MKLKCLAVDDEPLALEQLGDYIRRTPFLELVRLCSRSREALDILNEQTVDLLLTDIEMPDLNGMSLVRSLTHPPLIIFTTAYDSYAVESYRVNAIDYLLKPFSYEEFLQAAYKALDYLSRKQGSQNADDPLADALFVKAEYQNVRIQIPEISYIEGMKDYVRIHRPPQKPVMTLASLKSLEEKLKPRGFLRIHRSYIISLSKLASAEKNSVQLSTGERLPVGEQYREGLMHHITQRLLDFS